MTIEQMTLAAIREDRWPGYTYFTYKARVYRRLMLVTVS